MVGAARVHTGGGVDTVYVTVVLASCVAPTLLLALAPMV
jgi:hypothetical protein